MNVRSDATRILVITLAVIGALVVIGSAGMLVMHSSMMGDTPLHGLFSSMAAMCHGMMGG